MQHANAGLVCELLCQHSALKSVDVKLQHGSDMCEVNLWTSPEGEDEVM